MRNLKKSLCLVLSLAMMLSVMVMGTGAVYTDQASIKNTEAVDVLTALDVLDGYTDGSFRPNKVVTRAEMAKIITVVLNGGKDNAPKATTSTFSDMSGHWALGYVEACVAQGIIDGYQDGTFRPERTVTGTEAAKMLLTALGYDSEVYGYVGNNWAINVNVDAAKAGLYQDLADVDPSQGMARDNVAQMVYNMLSADVLEKSVDKYTSSGEVVYKYAPGVTAMKKYFGENKSGSGILVDIYYNKDTKEYTYSFVSASAFNKWGIPNGTDFNTDGTPTDDFVKEWGYGEYTSKTDYSDLFAQNVSYVVKGDDLYSMTVNKGGVVTEGVWIDVERNDNDYSNTIKIDKVKYRLDNVAKNATDLKVVGFNQFNDTFYNDKGLIDKNNLPAFEAYQNGDGGYAAVEDQYSFRAIDIDGGGDIDLFVVYPYFVLRADKVVADDYFRVNKLNGDDDGMLWVCDDSAEVQDDGLLYDLLPMNSKAATTFPDNFIAQAGYDPDVEFDDVQVNGTIAKDSYIQAIPSIYTAQGEDIYNVLEVKEGKASQLKKADLRVTFNGTVMDGALLTDGKDTIQAFRQLSAGETYTYVEVNTFLFHVDGETDKLGVEDYVVVTNTSWDTTGTVEKVYQAELLFSDGTTKLVNIAADKTPDHAFVGWIYTYEINSKGNYELTAVDPVDIPEGNDFDTYLPYWHGAPLPIDDYDAWADMRDALEANGRYESDKAGGKFVNDNGDTYRIDPDAVVFAYDWTNDEYSVMKGSDLEDYDENDIDVAFFAGNDFVELAYVAVPRGAGSTTLYAYIDDDTVRTIDDNDDYYVTFTAITEDSGADGQKFETKHQEDEVDLLQRFSYLVEDYARDDLFVKMILDKDGKVVYIRSVRGVYDEIDTISNKTANDAFELTFKNGAAPAFLDKEDTAVIFVDGSDRSGKTAVEDGDAVYIERDGKDLNVVYVVDPTDDRFDSPWW